MLPSFSVGFRHVVLYKFRPDAGKVLKDGVVRGLSELPSVATDDYHLLYAEGYLLEGTNARVHVEADTCPVSRGGVVAAATPAVAGRLGQDWVARLSGAGDVEYVGYVWRSSASFDEFTNAVPTMTEVEEVLIRSTASGGARVVSGSGTS